MASLESHSRNYFLPWMDWKGKLYYLSPANLGPRVLLCLYWETPDSLTNNYVKKVKLQFNSVHVSKTLLCRKCYVIFKKRTFAFRVNQITSQTEQARWKSKVINQLFSFRDGWLSMQWHIGSKVLVTLQSVLLPVGSPQYHLYPPKYKKGP